MFYGCFTQYITIRRSEHGFEKEKLTLFKFGYNYQAFIKFIFGAVRYCAFSPKADKSSKTKMNVYQKTQFYDLVSCSQLFSTCGIKLC